METVTLSNEFVTLRPLSESDYNLLLPFAVNEPETWEYSLVSAAGAEALKKYLDHALQLKADGKSLPFIVLNSKGEAAGSTRFYDYNANHGFVSIGYTWYGKDFRGTGINKHCKYLMLAYAFDELNLHRVELRADVNNARSLAAIAKIGAVREGTLREDCVSTKGVRRNSAVFGILKTEWDNEVRHRLKELV